MTGRKKAESILSRALDALRSAGADQAYARLETGAGALTRFANNYIHQNVESTNTYLSVVAAIGKRLGGAGTNRVDRSGISAVAQQAAAIAGQAAEDDEFPGFPTAPAAEALPEAWDAKTARLTPLARARFAARAVKRATKRSATASGTVSNGQGELAVANTSGAFQYCQVTHFGASCTCMADGAAGSEDVSARCVELARPAMRSFGRDAVTTAMKSRRLKDAEPGEWTVILSPRAAATMLRFLSYLGFNARAHQEGRSCLCGKMGTKVVSEKITLRDDGLSLDGQPFPFDLDGVPRKALKLIESGVARELAYDTRTAAKEGVESTGHSYGPLSSGGASPGHLFLEPGDMSVDEMIASTQKGLFVSRFWYVNVAEPARAVLTGMTRDGLFLISNGRRRHAVHNMRFTESILGALSRVEAVGAETVLVGGGWYGGVISCPALKIEGFRFSGATQF